MHGGAENAEIIYETINFLKEVSASVKSWVDKPASELISINYAQALPGTPGYEYARQRGFIGNSIDEGEEYLIRISDTDAYKEDHFVNLTGLPLLKVLMWRPIILTHLDAHHYLGQHIGAATLLLHQVIGHNIKLLGARLGRVAKRRLGELFPEADEKATFTIAYDAEAFSNSDYFNIHSGLKYGPLLFTPITRYFSFLLVAMVVLMHSSKSILNTLGMLYEQACWSLKPNTSSQEVEGRS